MMTPEDRWLLPRQQTEHPGLDLIEETTLHGRRERTFLVLATIAIAAVTSMLMLATAPVIDLGKLIESAVPSIELQVELALPLGIAASALAILAAMLATELYGRRRALSIVWASMFAAAAAIGVLHLVDLVTGAGTGIALALASYVVVAALVTVLAFSAMRGRMPARRQWTRRFGAALIGQFFGAAAFAAALYADATFAGDLDLARIEALTAGSAVAVLAASLVLLVPVALAAHWLGVYLRVERFAPAVDDLDYDEGPQLTRPPALIVDDGSSGSDPFLLSSTENMFFSDGEQLVD